MQLGGQVDAVVFSAGIGENAASVRAAICSGLEGLGIEFDAGKVTSSRCREAFLALGGLCPTVVVLWLGLERLSSLAGRWCAAS